jgi:UDP-N-acetylmuramyl tripeptide synthase
LGPNRRFDAPALELKFLLADGDQPLSEAVGPGFRESLSNSLAAIGLNEQEITADEPGTILDIGHVIARLIEVLLGMADHSVDGTKIILDEVNNELRVVIASDDVESNIAASNIAIAMMASTVPDRIADGVNESFALTSEEFQAFLAGARSRAMTPETKAIMRASRKIGLPVISLDRDPYEGVSSEHRIRPNGMLLLGHCREYRLLDGPVFVDQGEKTLPFIRAAGLRSQLLSQLGVPVFSGADHVDDCSALLLVGKEFCVALHSSRGKWFVINEGPHDLLVKLGRQISTKTAAAAVLLKFSNHDVSLAPGTPGGVTHVLDFDLAPRLDLLLTDQPRMLDLAAESLLAWGFPADRPKRVMTIAVTGTNGKTTTCMMIRAILRAAGRRVGLASSVGVVIENELTYEGDWSGFKGHLRVFESRDVDAAVLETARGGVVTMGFAFDACDVAVCTNVAGDHIGLDGVNTLDEMAEIKQSVLLRAQHAAVLNADNRQCLNMIEHLATDNICLVSTSVAADDLLCQIPGDRARCCVLEPIEGENWVVIYDPVRVPVGPIASMPATFEGYATFNVSNAMHAIAACFFAGHEIGRIRAAMECFRMEFDATPGRLNFYRAHPFDVLLDAMKNPAGALALARFVEQMDTYGRKFLMVQARGDRDDEFIKSIGTALAGHFDHYICQVHSVYPGEPESRAPALVKEALLESGVEEHRITLKMNLSDAVDTLLRMGAEGDLLVFAPGTGPAKSHVWKQILAFESEAGASGKLA